MPELRDPYDPRYCRATKCHWRSGNKCTESYCKRNGNEKRAHYYIHYGKLAIGDVPE